MKDIRQRNAKSGGHWFETETMRFFRSRVGKTVYGGHFFISPERCSLSDQLDHMPRRYTVRIAFSNGGIDTCGGRARRIPEVQHKTGGDSRR
jgi:hypothetical protein